ncbi:hypothetical protein ACO22_06717 [Paracoccidioides brasiliensis]|uniref:ERCC4 domain-containing protein n=1 Tax=Paracoccidioides brasiliensis TaxID=121759 RepID=A0A1D2J6N5_PARBR|nr:hypothetical protein ACO22_06717 [Paracoccidioides brasiliensis]
MPEVISLLSSPEDGRSSKPEQSSTATFDRLSDHPPRTPRIAILSDDSIFDWGDPTPAKKRRLSPELDPSPPNGPAPFPKTNHILFSDLEENIIFPPVPRLNNNKTVTANSSKWNGDISDSIEFTSPAVDATTANRAENRASTSYDVITIDDSIVEFDEPSSPGGPLNALSLAPSSSNLSNRTASLLSRIQQSSSTEPSKFKQKGVSPSKSKSISCTSKIRSPKPSQTLDFDDNDSLSVTITTSKTKRAPKASTSNKEAREAEKLAARVLREKERAEEKERKRKLKEQKAKEKQLATDLAEANKGKLNKKASTPEMIIDMSSTFEGSTVGNQVTEYMRHLGVEYHFVSPRMADIVTWRRKITAQYNEEAGHWEPCPLTIKEEDHVLCLLLAQKFVDMSVATTGNGNTLDSHVFEMKRSYPRCKLIYLIEGLTVWMRKNNNSKNRAYQASVLRELEGPSQLQPFHPPKRGRKTKQTATPPPPVDDDTIEDALLQLQVRHECLIQHTGVPSESAEWIKNFTEHISTVPYRHELINRHDASFCMDVGQVRTGEDNADTYVKMLQEIQRVTAPISYGITMQYPTVGELVRELKEQGPLLLENVKKCTNKSGALSDARIGPAISKRLHKVFTSLNPASTDA